MKNHIRDGKTGLLAGWCEADITPAGLTSIAGQFFERVSSEVSERLYATALALESDINGDTASSQAIIISCDLLNIEASLLERLRKTLSKQIPDFNSANLIMNATHIHTGPYTSKTQLSVFAGKVFMYHNDNPEIISPDLYGEFLLEKLSCAAVEAWRNRKGAIVERALGQAVVGHNRMTLYRDGRCVMYGNTDTENYESPCGPVDHGVEMLFFRNPSGQLEGMVLNVACPAQVLENMSYISSDYWGYVRKKINGKYGKTVHIMPLCSAAGDQSPRDLVRRGRAEFDMYNEDGVEELAARICREVEDVLENGRNVPVHVDIFKHFAMSAKLPLRKVTEKEVYDANEEYGRLIKENCIDDSLDYIESTCPLDVKYRLFILLGIMNRFTYQKSHRNYVCEIHAIRLGDIALVTNPFELFVEYGLQIKARSKAEQTLIAQLSCGCGGYLPTRRAVEAGGYGAIVASGFVGHEGGKALVDATVKLLNKMF